MASMTVSDIVQAFWPVFLVVLGCIIWAIRQEGRINHIDQKVEMCQKDVDDLRTRHETLDSKVVAKLSEISERLARIEGKLGDGA